MTKANQEKLLATPKTEDVSESVPNIILLADEETDLIGGGPEVENNGSH